MCVRRIVHPVCAHVRGSEEGERSAEVDCERYTDREDYIGRFTKALDELVAARWVLAEDRAAMLQLGEREWAEATK